MEAELSQDMPSAMWRTYKIHTTAQSKSKDLEPQEPTMTFNLKSKVWEPGALISERKNVDAPALEAIRIPPFLCLLYPGWGLVLLLQFVVPNASVFWKCHHRISQIMLHALHGYEGNQSSWLAKYKMNFSLAVQYVRNKLTGTCLQAWRPECQGTTW